MTMILDTTKAAQEGIEEARYSGYRILAGTILGSILIASGAQAAVLEDMTYSKNSGGEVEVVLSMDETPPNPQVFTTDTPPRIAVDLRNTSLALKKRTININVGSARNVMAVEAADRTRVVINLTQTVGFDTEIVGNDLILRIDSGAQNVATYESGRSRLGLAEESASAGINGIDFRRGSNGEGRVILSLDGTPRGSDLALQGNTIRLHLFETNVASDLEQRLDVIDFATPAQVIESYSEGDKAVIKVSAIGDFEHAAYQTENEFVIEIKPVEEEEILTADEMLQPPEYTGDKVTFTFQDIGIRPLLQLIADISGLNIVVSDSVEGSITLRLNNVPWDQALDLILQSKQLDKRQTGNVLWVAPASEIAAYEQAQLSAILQKEELEPIRSDYIQLSYAKASELASMFRGAGGESGVSFISDRGSVSVDERTNTLLISDTPTKLQQIRELVELLDRPVRQVQIESRIVIASSDFTRDLGVRFGVTGTTEDDNGNLYTTAGSLEALDRMNNLALINRLGGGGNFPNVGPAVPPEGLAVPPLTERLNVNLPVSGAAGVFGWTVMASDFLLDLELSALQEEGRGEVISNPRVVTINQKRARIRQGVEVPYQQASASGATTVQFKDATLELSVEPLITPDDRIQLDLLVKQDTVGEVVPTGTGGSVPTIDKREVETVVLVQNGQTVVLGGVYEQELRDQNTKVPFLGDLPAVGSLFRQRLRQFDKAELLIFITPTILQDNM